MPKDFLTLPNLSWTEDYVVNHCPYCHSELFDVSHSVGSRSVSRILYCRKSIYIDTPQEPIYNPWDPMPEGASMTIDGHFHMRFEEEIVGAERKERRRWTSYVYKQGDCGFEICHRRTLYADAEDDFDTVLNKWGRGIGTQQIILPKRVKFNIDPESAKRKLDSLYMLE